MDPITLGVIVTAASLSGASLCFSHGMDIALSKGAYGSPKKAAGLFASCALLIGLGVGTIPWNQQPSRAITATAQWLSSPVFR
jgi:hypothetical protein